MSALGNSSGEPLQLFLQLILAPFLPVSILTRADQSRVQLTSVQREIMDLTRQGLEAARRKDSTFKQRILTDDALDVGEFGIWDKERSAASIASLEKHPNF